MSFEKAEKEMFLKTVEKAIDSSIAKSQLLEPLPEDMPVKEAIRIAELDVRADIESARDSIKHFAQSIKYLPLYIYLEDSVDYMLLVCKSVEQMLDNEEAILKLGSSSRETLSKILANTFNHYHSNQKERRL